MSVSLEPRLQEYIRRKKFNHANNISPDISEEYEFAITPTDKELIKYYVSGNTKMYKKTLSSDENKFIEPIVTEYNDNLFKEDFRYKRLEKKMTSHKQAQKKIQDLSQMDPEYKIFTNSNPFVEEKRPIVPAFGANAPAILDGRDFSNDQYRYNVNSYNHPPKISFNQYVFGQFPHNTEHEVSNAYKVDDAIGQFDDYGKYLTASSYMKEDYDKGGYVDLDTHTFVPKIRDTSQRDNCNCYNTVPFMYGGGPADVSVEDALRGGLKDGSKKTIGFKNAFENQFYYISSDITEPNHNVMSMPSATRGTSKVLARPKKIQV